MSAPLKSTGRLLQNMQNWLKWSRCHLGVDLCRPMERWITGVNVGRIHSLPQGVSRRWWGLYSEFFDHFVITTQPESWYSFCYTTEGGRLAELTLTRVVHHNECCDIHNITAYQNLPTWLRRGYLPSCKSSSTSDKGFRFCACAISHIKLFTRLFFRFFGFFISSTAKTPARILTQNTSKDAVPRKDVPFGGPKTKS